MDFPAVLATLLDLPSTFTRDMPWFTQLTDATAFEISIETNGTDDILAQVQNLQSAQDGWIDIYGLLAGVPRNQGEGNGPYATRISETVLAWVGTVPAVQVWVNLFAPGGSVVENLNGYGYVLTLPGGFNALQIANFLMSFNRIRPIGVPFKALQGTGGLYLGTVEYLSNGDIAGSYLAGGTPVDDGLGAVTNSSKPLLPTLMLTDPILNPSLYPALPLP